MITALLLLFGIGTTCYQNAAGNKIFIRGANSESYFVTMDNMPPIAAYVVPQDVFDKKVVEAGATKCK